MSKPSSKKKIRLDLHLARASLSATREKAKRDILAGWVKVDGETVTDPARAVAGTETITVARPGGLYVSRGGPKLRRGLDSFGIDLRGRVCADLGASTGGFTDCMLKEGAVKVYAIDVGYGQLDYGLRVDPRVVVMEKTNARHLSRDAFLEPPDFIAADLSFISVLKIAPTIRDVFAPAEGVILVKPQFEAGPGEQKKGVVRGRDAHAAILRRVAEGLAAAGFSLLGLDHSPVKGPRGNIEFLVHFRVEPAAGPAAPPPSFADIIDATVDRAHASLGSATEKGE